MVCNIPFGFPVEPEVYKMNKGSSASIISATLFPKAASKSGCNQMSRPSFIFTAVLVRLATNTFSTQGHFSNASSTIPFKSTDLLPLNPPSDVITILHSESLILAATAEAEKPANTTE